MKKNTAKQQRQLEKAQKGANLLMKLMERAECHKWSPRDDFYNAAISKILAKFDDAAELAQKFFDKMTAREKADFIRWNLDAGSENGKLYAIVAPSIAHEEKIDAMLDELFPNINDKQAVLFN